MLRSHVGSAAAFSALKPPMNSECFLATVTYDGGLPRIPASSCWCYAFSSPQKSVYRYERKVPSCYFMFLPLWTLEECRGSLDIFSSTITAELAELAFEFAGGVPRTVLQLPAQPANSSVPIRSLIVGQLETAVNMLSSEVICCSLLLLQRLITGNRCVGKPQQLINTCMCPSMLLGTTSLG